MDEHIYSNLEYAKMVLVFKVNTIAGIAGKKARGDA
jgi:hypothetical protein